MKFFLIFILSFLSFAQKIEKKELEVAIGIDVVKKFEYKYSPKIQIGNQSVLKLILTPAKQEIVFRGLKQGKTSVTIKDTAGETKDIFIVTVTSDGLSETVKNLRELIGDVEGINIGIKGGIVVVEGELVVAKDIGRINSALSRFENVLKRIELSPQTQRVIARKMQEEINKNNMKDVTVRILNGDFWLEGVVNGEGKKTLAESIANQYLPDRLDSLAVQESSEFSGKKKNNIVNFISVNEQKDPPPPKKLIKITAQFVELTKSYNKVFGFSWTPGVSSGGGSIGFGQNGNGEVGTSNNDSLSGTISNLFPKLSSGKSAGYARVLQSGMVIVKEGTQASIKKNRAIPFAVGSGDFQQGASTNISFTLSVTPSVGANETVDMKALNIEVALPAENAANGSPTSTTNNISTNITVKSKQSAAIGGIVQSTSSTNYDKDRPGGTASGSQSTEDTSPLFDLLRSKSYNTSKSQFVMFVTPEIIESASAGTEKIRKKFRKRQR